MKRMEESRNIFEAFLSLVKPEKVEDENIPYPNKSVYSTSSLDYGESPCIKPEADEDVVISGDVATPPCTDVSSHRAVSTILPEVRQENLPVPISMATYSPVQPVMRTVAASNVQITLYTEAPLKSTFSGLSQQSYSTTDGCSSLRISCANTVPSICPQVTTVLNRVEPTPSIQPPLPQMSPVEELQVQTSRFNLSFGCLDDLLPHNDPDRCAYVHQKCTKLRYPLPLAVAMSRLYSPSNLPNIASTLSNGSSITSNRQFSSHRRRKPDQGFLEIDASHFTLTTSSTIRIGETPQQDPERPRTKAQLRRQVSAKSANGVITDDQERLKIPEAPLLSLVAVSRPTQSQTPINKPTTSRTQSASIVYTTPTTIDAENTLSDTPPTAPPTEAKTNRKNPPRRNSRSSTRTEMTSSLVPITPHLPCTSDLELDSGSTPLSAEELHSTGVSIYTLSSQHFTPTLCGAAARTPHLAYLQLPPDPTPRSACYLLLGDAVRIICLLLKKDGCRELLLRHCCLTQRKISSKYLRLDTPNGLLEVCNTSVVESSIAGSSPSQFILIPWPVVFYEALTEAIKLVPREALWRFAVPEITVFMAVKSIMNGTYEEVIETVKSPHRGAIISSTSPKKQQHLNEQLTSLNNNNKQNEVSVKRNIHRSPIGRFHHLPFTICRSLLRSNSFPENELEGLEFLTNLFRNSIDVLFVSPKSLFKVVSSSRKAATTELSANLFTCLFELHDVVSTALRVLRNSYARIVSAGSCLTARYNLANRLADFDEDQIRIERGRARLFETVDSARYVLLSALRHELIPAIVNIHEQCRAACLTMNHICSDEILLGPFSDVDSRVHSHTQCELKRAAMCSAVSTNINGNSLDDLSREHVRLCKRVFNYLDNTMRTFIRDLSLQLVWFKSRFRMTMNESLASWIPAFEEGDLSASSFPVRANEDLKLFTNNLQTLLDVFEVWVRVNHNQRLVGIGSRMLCMLHAMHGVDRHIGLNKKWHLPNTRLYLPYGSKNTPETRIAVNFIQNVNPLPKWPPVITTQSYSSQMNEKVSVPTTISARPNILTSTNPNGQVVDISSISTSSKIDMVVSYDDLHVSSAKRICIDLSQNSDEESISTCPMTEMMPGNQPQLSPTHEEDAFDRRQLGKLKRRLKISHAAAANGPGEIPMETVQASEMIETDPARLSSSAMSEVEVMNNVKAQHTNSHPGEALTPSSEIVLDSASDYQEHFAENPTVNVIDNDSVVVSPTGQHNPLIVDTSFIPMHPDTVSNPLTSTHQDILSIPTGPISAPVAVQIPNELEEPNALLSTATNSIEATKPNGNYSPPTALDIDKVAADLNRLMPWLEQKARHIKAPGPITAAILAQNSMETNSVSIDLTTDD